MVGETGQIRRIPTDPYHNLEYSLEFQVEDPSVLSINEKGEWKALKTGMTTVTVLPAQADQNPSFMEELTPKGWHYFSGIYLGNAPAPAAQLQQFQSTKFTVIVLENKVVPPTLQIVPMYRLYNPNNHEHFYTANKEEKDYLIQIGWGQYEGIAWYVTEGGSQDKSVYRLYNPILKDHHYTIDQNEVYSLTSKHHWKLEGIAWYSFGSKKVYRLFHPYLTSGSHHYTLDENEVSVLRTRGWIYEENAWITY